jgi:hypothetical protein
MILKSSNWQPAIPRSIKGNSTYNFLNQVFEADIGKLKIESLIINKPLQVQIIPLTLTVVYEENIEDEIFSIPLGNVKPIAILIDNLKPYPFKLQLENPNRSQIRLTVQKPKVVKIKLANAQSQNSITTTIGNNYTTNTQVQDSDKKDDDINIVFANSSGVPTITTGTSAVNIPA